MLSRCRSNHNIYFTSGKVVNFLVRSRRLPSSHCKVNVINNLYNFKARLKLLPRLQHVRSQLTSVHYTVYSQVFVDADERCDANTCRLHAWLEPASGDGAIKATDKPITVNNTSSIPVRKTQQDEAADGGDVMENLIHTWPSTATCNPNVCILSDMMLLQASFCEWRHGQPSVLTLLLHVAMRPCWIPRSPDGMNRTHLPPLWWLVNHSRIPWQPRWTMKTELLTWRREAARWVARVQANK